MSITQTYLNLSIAELKTFLETLVPDYFASVEYTDDTSTGITCKDSDGNTIFTVAYSSNSGWTYTAYADGENYVSKKESAMKPTYGYTCANGAMIVCSNNGISTASDIRGSVIIFKTNNNKTGFVIGGGSNYGNIFSGFNTCAWGDITPLISSASGYKFGEGVTNQTQTLMFPFVTRCALGEHSYFPNAFFIPVAQTRTVFGELVADGISYVTNGYWAIKDE